jgi:hypothetical protein
MEEGEGFTFLCKDIMAEKMDRVIAQAGGEITGKDVRSYGVVIWVRKKRCL